MREEAADLIEAGILTSNHHKFEKRLELIRYLTSA